MNHKKIHVRNAREHNLQNIDVTIPKNKMTVVTGVSGSGKSSLAFDTIFREGQRRYLESFSSYARSFLGKAGKPSVESITGLLPAISTDGIGIIISFSILLFVCFLYMMKKLILTQTLGKSNSF